MSTLTAADRLAGGLYGLLIGDAVGVPYEFHDASELPPLHAIDMCPPADFNRAHRGVPIGTWSDDGAQALCLLASLQQQGRLDTADFARRLRNWANVGYLAVDNHVFDIGMQTQQALSRLEGGMAPEEAGPRDVKANGNGSLMRVLPLALWHRGSDAELVADACAQSRVTHGHERALVICAFYCLWARELLAGHDNAWQGAIERLQACLPEQPALASEAQYILSPSHGKTIRGSGYVLDSLWSARLALEAAGDYAGVVRAAIALGNDTDTTACIAGGLAGIRHGLQGIPQAWLDALRGQDMVQPLLTSLLERT